MNIRPSDPGALIQMLIRAADRAAGWRRAHLWSAVVIGLGTATAIDAATGIQVSMFLLYLFVAAFAAWCLGERPGLAITIVVAIVSTVIRALQSHVSGHPIPLGVEAWNLVARICSVGMLVVATSGLRAVIALERWRASTDGLTGALNKMAFQERMTDRVQQAAQTGGSLVLCYMDLDGFKQVNDHHGHAAGDRVLQVFSEGAAAMIRREDAFARIGGDEFVALLSVASPEEGDRVAEMMHARLSAVLGATALEVTCSMGALVATGATMAEQGEFVAIADRLMYEVKRGGKNALRIGRMLPAIANDDPAPARSYRRMRRAA